ncbi:hypothetical protein QCA50_016722 [Cerrena zonata]|uniref:Transcriptional repressor Tup1 N-terminal domain-containing protein n=1 Tax=Cerrena zonata TaxID=2478898 RepID=A0AAW0FET2_9APHY
MASYHKHIQPTGPPPSQAGPSGAMPGSIQGPPVPVVAGTAAAQQMIHSRLNDSFDNIRHEFDLLAQEIVLLRGQRDDFENKVTSQVNELNIIRQSLYELETQHAKVRGSYEEQIRQLRQDLENMRTQRDGPPPPREGIASLGRSDSVREQERIREREVLLGIVTGGSGASIAGGPNTNIPPPPSSATIGPAAPGGGPPRGEASGREALGLGRPGLPSQMMGMSHHPPPPGGSNALPPAFSGPGGAPPPPPPMSGPGGGPMSVDSMGHGMHPGHPGGPPHMQSLPPHMHPGPLGLGVGAGDRERERESREPRDRERERDRLERDRERERERSERERERERYYDYSGGPPIPGRGPPERTMSGDVVMRDARSSTVPGAGDRDRERERDVVMRDSFRDSRAERGLERSESMRDMRDREMQMRMERDRERMDRMDRGDRGDRDMRDVGMRDMRERDRFLERDPSTSRMDRDPRGLEPPVVLGRDRERDREGVRDGRDVKKVKTEQPPTPGGVGAGSPGKDKDGRKGGGDPFSPTISTHPQAPPPPGPPGNPNALPPPGPGAPPPSQPPPHPPPFAAGNLPPTPNANGRDREGRGSMSGIPTVAGEQTPKLPVVPGPPYPGPPNGPNASAEGEAGPTAASGPEPYPPKETGEDASAPGSGPVDLSGIDVRDCPDELKREGSDWFAVFTPAAGETTKNDSGAVVPKRNLDVTLVHTLIHESVVCCVRFSADGKFLATGCNRTAQIYDTKTGAKTCVLSDEDSTKTGDLYIRSVCFSPDGKYLATGAEDKQIRIWDIATRKICGVYEGHQQEIYSLDYSKDGRLIVSGSGDRTARIWDTKDQSNNKILTINEGENVDAGVTSVCISPNGRLVAAGSLDTIVRIWDVQTGALVERLKGHRDSVYSVAFTPDGAGLVSGSLDKTLKYWDLRPILSGRSGAGPSGAVAKAGANGKEAGGGEKGSLCTMNFVGHKDYVLSVAVSHDGRWVVSGSKDRGVQFWDAKSAMVQCMLQGHKNSVISIDLSPAGSILATGSGDWQARIWSYSAQ